MLKNKFGFDPVGIKSNITLFDYANKEFDLLSFLDRIAPNALRAESPQGYIINAIKKHLKEECGVLFEDHMVMRTKPKTVATTVSKNEPKSLKDILGEEL